MSFFEMSISENNHTSLWTFPHYYYYYYYYYYYFCHFMVLCPQLPGTRRNIHPLAPILIINNPLSASFIYDNPQHPPCSIYMPDSLYAQPLFKFSLVYLLINLLIWDPPLPCDALNCLDCLLKLFCSWSVSGSWYHCLPIRIYH